MKTGRGAASTGRPPKTLPVIAVPAGGTFCWDGSGAITSKLPFSGYSLNTRLPVTVQRFANKIPAVALADWLRSRLELTVTWLSVV